MLLVLTIGCVSGAGPRGGITAGGVVPAAPNGGTTVELAARDDGTVRPRTLRRLRSDCAALTRADVAALEGPDLAIVRSPTGTIRDDKRSLGASRYCAWNVESGGDLASARLWYQVVPRAGVSPDNGALPGWIVEPITVRGLDGVSKCVVDDYVSQCATEFAVKGSVLAMEVRKDTGPPNQDALRALDLRLTDRVLAHLAP